MRRKKLRRRPLCDRRDLGHRVEKLFDQMGAGQTSQSTRERSPASAAAENSRTSFLSALEILHRRRSAPRTDARSWAGAFGRPNFMRTAFKRYAVDADGDAAATWSTMAADLIASTANNLKKDGWADRPRLGLRGWWCRKAFN